MWKLMLAGAISFLVLDAGYFFRGTGSRLADLSFESAAIQPLNRIGAPWRNVPIPIPADYLRGVDHQRRIMEAEHPVYLDGTWRTSGFPDYFVRALGYKLSHATQYLLFLAVVWLIFPGREPRLMASQFALLIPAALLLLLGSTTSMQLGIRYQLPAFPLMFIFAGQTARWIDWKQYRLRAVLVCVAIAALPFSWRYHPHHIAYFNELAGGPTGGANHLLDSNIDWGQDLGGLQHYVDEQGLGEIGLAYFGMVPPSHAGFSYRLPPSRLPAPGWYAVSLNFVYGRPHTIRNPAGVDPPIRSVDFEEFGYFRLFQPSARIGWSIYVYHLTPADIERVGLPSG